jgi:uncharacterized protein YndB with AHSA1/START domain
MRHVAVEAIIEAPVQAVWDLYTDHVSWTRWAGLGTVRLAREGVPAPNGVGCVRAITSFGVGVEEEVLSFDPPSRMTYRVIRGGIPMRDHFGEVRFEPHPRGTRVLWRCQFESSIPGLGGLFQFFITRLFRNALAGLARQPFPQATSASEGLTAVSR